MRVPSIWIRNRKTGKRVKVNVSDWASDLGQGGFSGWERVTGEVDDTVGAKLPEPPKKTVHEVGKVVEPEPSPGRTVHVMGTTEDLADNPLVEPAAAPSTGKKEPPLPESVRRRQEAGRRSRR